MTVSGDPEGAPRLRLLNDGVQVLADYCLPGGEMRETISILGKRGERVDVPIGDVLAAKVFPG